MKINAEVRQIMAEPAIHEQFVTKQLYEPMTSSPEEFAEFIRSRDRALGQDHPRAEPADRPLTLRHAAELVGIDVDSREGGRNHISWIRG